MRCMRAAVARGRAEPAPQGAPRRLVARLRAFWVRRLLRAPVRFTDRHGLSYTLYPTDDLELYFRHRGWFEVGEQEFCRRYLLPGMTAFDVGAYIGVYTCFMARLVGPTGQVHAFEPSRATHQRLLDNIRMNGIANAVANCQAAYSGSARVPLFLYGPPLESLSSLVHRQTVRGGTVIRPASEVSAEAVSLDDYCERREIDRIDLLKLDAEGAEPEVLTGAERLLGRASIRTVLFEVGAGIERLLDRLEARGFRFFTVGHDGSLTAETAAGLRRVTNVVARHG